jgi:hypothetical protein
MKKFIFFALIIFSLFLAGLETETTTQPDTTPRIQCQFLEILLVS